MMKANNDIQKCAKYRVYDSKYKENIGVYLIRTFLCSSVAIKYSYTCSKRLI